MHAKGPLLADNRALRPRQDDQTRKHRRRQPKRNDPEHRRMRPDFIRQQDSGADRVRDDQERHVSRRIVSAVAAEVLATDLAGVDDLEIGPKQATASAAPPSPYETA